MCLHGTSAVTYCHGQHWTPALHCTKRHGHAPVNVSKPKTGGLLDEQNLVRQLAAHVIVPPVCTPNSIHVLHKCQNHTVSGHAGCLLNSNRSDGGPEVSL